MSHHATDLPKRPGIWIGLDADSKNSKKIRLLPQRRSSAGGRET